MTPTPSEPQADLIKACPYLGLVPYSEAEADFFFGRQGDTQVIVANCLTTRVTLFYGTSGVGKSSVLYAGVMRELRRRALAGLANRKCPESVGVSFSSWRDDPVAGLIARVDESLRKVLPADWLPKMPSPAATLADSLRAWTEWIQSDIVLLLDQFEEYFLYRDTHDTSFADELVAVINDPDLRVNVLISIREDALARLDTLKADIPELFSNGLRLEHLTTDSARHAIEGPLKLYNERLPADAPRVDIEPALIEEVLTQVQAGRVRLRQAGAGSVRAGSGIADNQARVEAPYLQLVMMRLWREDVARGSQVLRLATLQALGGAKNILRTHLDVVMAQLPAADQALAAKVFHQLVTPSGTKIAHYVSDLAQFAETTPGAVAHMCELLEDWKARVLRDVTPPGAESKRYEIFHDLLAAPILDWRQRRVAEEMAAEQRRSEEEQRRALSEKWRRRLVATFCIGVLIAGSVIVWLHGEKATAQAEAAAATKQKEDAKKAETDAKKSEDDAKKSEDAARKDFKDTDESTKKNIAAASEALQKLPDNVRNTPAYQAITDALSSTEIARKEPLKENDAPAAPITLPVLPVVTAEGAAKMTTDKINASHVRNVWNADYSSLPDGGVGSSYLITSGSDRKAVVMDLKGSNDFVLKGHKDEVNAVLINPDRTAWDKGWFAATASDDNTARVWKFVSAQLPVPSHAFAELKGHVADLTGLMWSKDGHWLVTTSKDHKAIIWDVSGEKPKAVKTLDQSTGSVWLPALVETSANGAFLATPSSDGNAYIYTFPEGKYLRALEHGASVRRAVLSPDGKLVLTAGADGRAVLWDRASGDLLAQAVHEKAVRDVAFDATGKYFVTGSADGTAQVWETQPREGVFAQKRDGLVVLKGHTAPVFSVAFVPGSNRVVTTSWDRTAIVWDFLEKKCLAVCNGHTDVIWSVKCSPDGRHFCTTGGDGTTRLWDLKKILGTE